MRKKKIFLICPVRGTNDEITKRIGEYVKKLEEQGHRVHWPLRDTNQDDPIGLRICTDNTNAIIWADEVHVWWWWQEKKWWQRWMWWIKEKKSTGSLFDLGISFLLHLKQGKPIILANPEDVKTTENKSFNNVLLALHALYAKKEERKWN